jgi:hypothetical protein
MNPGSSHIPEASTTSTPSGIESPMSAITPSRTTTTAVSSSAELTGTTRAPVIAKEGETEAFMHSSYGTSFPRQQWLTRGPHDDNLVNPSPVLDRRRTLETRIYPMSAQSGEDTRRRTMSVINERSTEVGQIEWLPVSGVQPVVFVGRLNRKPVGILEMKPTTGFRATTCTGKVVGDFATLDEGERAFSRWLAEAGR